MEEANKNEKSISELLSESMEEFKKHTNLLIGIGLLILIPSAMLGAFIAFYGTDSGLSEDFFEESGWVVFGIIFVFATLMNILTTSMMFSTFTKILREKTEVNLSESFQLGMSNLWKVLVWGIIYFAIVGLGFLLLIIPGIIFAFIFVFGFNLVVDKKLSYGETLRESRLLFKENRTPTILMALSLMGISIIISIIASIFIGIISVVSGPLADVLSAAVQAAINLFTVFAFTYFYLYISQASKSSSSSELPSSTN